MISKRKYKYTMPIKWYDCRISLRGKKVYTVCGQQYACTSKKCKSIHCIKFQTNKETKIRLVNYYLSPPDYFVVLRLENISFPLGWFMTSELLKGFKKKLKDDSKSQAFEFEWEFVIEFDDYKYPHFHMAITNNCNNGKLEIKSQFKRFLQKVWNYSISTFKEKYEKYNKDNVEQIQKLNDVFGSVYCEKIISISGTAVYLSKGKKHVWKYNSAPEDWDLRKCHLVSSSRGFLVKEKAELLKIYNQNKQFFEEWKSVPLKDKQDDEILLAIGSDIKDSTVESDISDTSVVSVFNDKPIAILNKEVIVKKPSSTTWVSKILTYAAWGCALIGSLVFVINKIQSLSETSYSFALKSDQDQRTRFMLKWFLENGFEYYQNE